MANTIIQLKHSTVTGNTPASLANGEISINSRDGKLFYSTPLGVVTAFNPYPGPSGLNQEIQFNDSGVLGSNSGLTFNKSTGYFKAPIIESTNNGSGTNFKIGDDAWIGDINLSDTIRISGQQNVNNAYIVFGASNANTLGRSGTGPLTYTGDFTSTGFLSGREISSTQSSGDEGGQINLALAATNTSLSGSVAIDIFQNRLRIFETSGTNRGVFIDLANGASSSVGTNLLQPSSSTDGWARNQANAAFISSNTIQTYVTTANANITAAFIAANSAGVYANGAFAAANLRATTANASIAWNTANAAFVRANNSLDANNGGTVTGTITATAFITTGAFGNITGANTIYANNFVANTGFIQFSDGTKQYTANAGSSGGGTTDQVARNTANAAFIKANTGTSGANSFGQIIANVGTILATSSNDSLQIVGESGISVSSNVSAKKIIISVPAGFTFTTADYGFVTDSTNIIYDYGTI